MGLRERRSLQQEKKNVLAIYPIYCFTQMIGKTEQMEDLSMFSQKMKRTAAVYRWDENTNQCGQGFLCSTCMQALGLTA